MTQPHEIVIRFGRPHDLQLRGRGGAFTEDVTEITIPFADGSSAFAAHRAMSVLVRPVHDAGGEVYHPVLIGELAPDMAYEVHPPDPDREGNPGA